MRAGVIIAIVLTGIMAFAGAVLFVTRDHFQPRAISIFGDAPSFAFTDSEGKAFDSASLRGKIWAINFFFTSCKGICPTVSSSIARLSKVFEKNHEVEFVSLSIDPETDTSEVLGKYAQKYNANSKRWHFLTGNKSAIDEVINKGFQLGNGDKLDEHSGRVVLVDKLGRVRGYYQGTDAEAIEKLENDLSTLLDSN